MKKILVLTIILCLFRIMGIAQLPSTWESVQGEYLVSYKVNQPMNVLFDSEQLLPFLYKVDLKANDVDSLWNNPIVDFISEVYQDDDCYYALTNKILVVSSSPIRTLLHDVDILSEVQRLDSICIEGQLCVYVIQFSTRDPLGLCNLIKQHPGCVEAEVNYVFFKPKEAYSAPKENLITQSSEDTPSYYGSQWALDNKSYPLFDINVLDAWEISKGAGIKVAVVDEGVDLDHEDLVGNLLPGYDAVNETYGGASGGYSGNDDHGTKCAGIIGAIDNDFGVTGVAPHSKIIPIRVAYTNAEGYWVTSNSEWVLSGLVYAMTSGVDVISNSWSSTSYGFYDYVLTNLLPIGRNGKGIISVHAAGNDSESSISYPSYHQNVIAVGAMSPCGERKSYQSCDGETWWGSNYGDGLDIVAPGVGNPTTTIGNEYSLLFNGTSAACPHVAGVAALMLSVNPNLTSEEVREIICRTAVKLPDYTFVNASSSNPYGKWNEEVGYGLVDATAAVFSAMAKNFSISGPSSICREETYTIDGLPDDAEVQWTSRRKFTYRSFR